MRQTILWIEDDMDFLNAGCDALRQNGFDVLAATNNNEALAFLRRHGRSIGLIIQNLHRPPGQCLSHLHLSEKRFTGMAFLAHHIRKMLPDVSCIFVTGTPWVYHARRETKRLGNCILLEEPVQFNYLADMARAMTTQSWRESQ